jgi:hypothetical protein
VKLLLSLCPIVGLAAGRLSSPQKLRLWTIPALGLIFDAWLPGLVRAVARTIELRPWMLLKTPLLAKIAVRGRRFGLTGSWLRLCHGGSLERGFALARLLIAFLRLLSSKRSPILLLLRHMLLIIGLCRGQNAQIVLGVLVIALRHDRIPGRMRIPCELHVLFGDRLRCAADLHIGTIALIDAVDGIAPASTASAAATWAAASAAAPRSLVMIMVVLALSHDLLYLTFVAFTSPRTIGSQNTHTQGACLLKQIRFSTTVPLLS